MSGNSAQVKLDCMIVAALSYPRLDTKGEGNKSPLITPLPGLENAGLSR